MRMKLLCLASIVGALAVSASAQAKTYALGTLVDGEDKTTDTTNYTGGNTYTDKFTFSLNSTFDSYFTGAFTEAGKFDISSVDISLYTKAGKLLASTGAFNPTKVATPTLFDELDSGSYYLTDTFTVPHGKDSSYTLTATTISAAPEPAAWALIFAGVALTGGIFRYSRRSQVDGVKA